MMNVSITQALDLWDQLHAAMEGRNSYGGHVAEIYIYTLLGHSSIFARNPGDSLVKEEVLAANTALLTLCKRFAKQHNVIIAFEDGTTLDILDGKGDPFTWRVHLRVTKENEDGKGELQIRCQASS